ncbi:actin-histidine N-methyltransferase-like [Uloborus diversus]|uniref:actin-histidine N-methyltransferase-like n=1 Tax=Uloborus diversus TaxID=327109 RepID=UPI002409E289|nr:actin-histidine N-methyltransferase-like [Uloborus diversus]
MAKIPRQVKDKIKPLVQKLLDKCSNVKVLTRKLEWEEITEILKLVELIQNIEKDHRHPFPDRNVHWNKFYSWCKENGADFDAVKVKEISDKNFGLIAEKDIKENDPFLFIPRKIMMTENSASSSRLGPLISKDPVLQHMPNVQVAMHLLLEFIDTNSFWKPYINILPSSYDTILYFSLPELQELQGSPVLDEAFKLIRSVARQYCYFFQLFQNDSYARSLNIGSYFTFELYRWAVSTVMTRQNFVPSPDGRQKVTALVPLFDMCNHIGGKLSTDFNLEKDSLVSYSCKAFSTGDEVCMFYGARTNCEYFLHNAFVYPENENDALEIKLGISKSDPLYSLRNDLCNKLNFPLNDAFRISKEKYISERLLLFLKIIVMKSDELQHAISEADNIHTVLEKNSDLNHRALRFLRDRIQLLLKSYRTTLEEDETILKSSVFESSHQQLIVNLRICEKKIFHCVYDYCCKNVE